MNEQTTSHYKQNRRPCFSRKGDHERNEQSNHAQTIATFYNSGHVPLIVKQIYCRFLGIWRNIGFTSEKKHRVFGLPCHQLRDSVHLQFGRIELTEIALVNKGQKQVSQQKLSQKRQKGFIAN